MQRARYPDLQAEALSLMQLLLDHGLDINSPGDPRPYGEDNRKQLPLLRACETTAEMVNWLLERGARVDETNAQGETAWHCAAAQAPHIDILEALLGYSSAEMFNQEDHKGLTPFHHALQWCRLERSQWLVNHGVRLDTHLDHPPGKVAPALHLLMKHFGCDGQALELGMEISKRHPDCGSWLTEEGVSIASWCKKEGSAWLSMIEHTQLNEETPVSLQPSRKMRL